MTKVVALGEIIVEIVAVRPGDGFREPIELYGPYPSGAPAIFIDQLAKQGQKCAIVGCVGNDDFGRLNIHRLAQDGVDVSAVRVHEDAVTGSAFVRYRGNGERDFVFNIKHSASGQIEMTSEARAVVNAAGHLHVMGSSLVSPRTVEVVMSALRDVKSRGGTVSFDPNIRKEMLSGRGLEAVLNEILEDTDIFLPSAGEMQLFSSRLRDDAAARDILGRGVKAVVLKQGANGTRYLDDTQDILVPAYTVQTVDPTGAGDAFGATFIAGWLNRVPVLDNLRRANAAGALAVSKLGPMEGTSTSAELDKFLAEYSPT